MRLFVINRFGAFLLHPIDGSLYGGPLPMAMALWRDTMGFWWKNYRVDSLPTMLQNFTDMANKPANWGWGHFSTSPAVMPEWIRAWDERHPVRPKKPQAEFSLGYRTGPRFGPDVYTINHVGIYDPKGRWICNVMGGPQAEDLLAILSRIKEN